MQYQAVAHPVGPFYKLFSHSGYLRVKLGAEKAHQTRLGRSKDLLLHAPARNRDFFNVACSLCWLACQSLPSRPTCLLLAE